MGIEPKIFLMLRWIYIEATFGHSLGPGAGLIVGGLYACIVYILFIGIITLFIGIFFDFIGINYA